MKVWALTEEFSEGKYLVTRRDGTTPAWPHFVIGANDPSSDAALQAYAADARLLGRDPAFCDSVEQLAVEFARWRVDNADRHKIADPDAPPHRPDNPTVIAMMRHETDVAALVAEHEAHGRGSEVEDEGALTDLISDAISDSMDMDWTSADGAKAVVRALLKANAIRFGGLPGPTPSSLPVEPRPTCRNCGSNMTDAEIAVGGFLSCCPERDMRSPAAIECYKLDTPTHVFFYEQDFYVLSNFSAFSVMWGGLRFDTSEAVYHWEKFALTDHEICAAIRRAPSAHEAFKIAQEHKHLRRPDWDEVKVDVMRRILRAKVDQHEYVRRKLLATGDRELVEDSWRDDFWGWGPNRDGQNMLGKLWMELRAKLRAAPDQEGDAR